MNCGMNPWVARWFGFTDYAPTVPQLYWNVDGNEQRYHLLCKQLHKLVCYADMLGQKITINHEQIDALEKEFTRFKNGALVEFYEKQVEAWINAHMPDIIGKYIHMVFFGLTLDGYFVAYIPEGSGWNDIIFDTGAVYGSDTYGRLILLMDVDGASPVMPNYANQSDMGELQRMLSDLTNRVEANENTLYNPLNESEVDNA